MRNNYGIQLTTFTQTFTILFGILLPVALSLHAVLYHCVQLTYFQTFNHFE